MRNAAESPDMRISCRLDRSESMRGVCTWEGDAVAGACANGVAGIEGDA